MLILSVSFCQDHAVTRRQKHGLGVIRRPEEAGDLPRRQVSPQAELLEPAGGHKNPEWGETKASGWAVDNAS